MPKNAVQKLLACSHIKCRIFLMNVRGKLVLPHRFVANLMEIIIREKDFSKSFPFSILRDLKAI
jgi:hypothetical protein